MLSKNTFRAGFVLLINFVEDTKDIETAEGAGTIGLELLKLPYNLDALLVALGDGAMFEGIARIMKEFRPNTKMIAIQSEEAPALIESLRSKQYVSYKTTNTIADGIAVKRPMKESIQNLTPLIDKGILVKEESLIKGIRLIKERLGVIAEPSASVGIAATLENGDYFKGKNVGTIICGGNLSKQQYKDYFSEWSG